MFFVRKAFIGSACLLVAFLCCFVLASGSALADTKPTRSETLIAGPYVIDVTLSQDPPFTDQPFEITVMAHNSTIRLSGLAVAQPGLGTDATNLQTKLTPVAGTSGAISGWIHIPVRGAWQLVLQLDGPQGQSSASMALTVAGPGAMPVWIAWVISTIPLIFIAWWIYQQRRYRSRLLIESGQ
jgi:hypothetical protein